MCLRTLRMSQRASRKTTMTYKSGCHGAWRLHLPSRTALITKCSAQCAIVPEGHIEISTYLFTKTTQRNRIGGFVGEKSNSPLRAEFRSQLYLR
jgi:hypothetical protein